MIDPVKKVKELIEQFFALSNPGVSDLEDLVLAINLVIDEVDLTPNQVSEINKMIRSVSITYTIGEIDSDEDQDEDESSSFDYTQWEFTEDDSYDESSSFDPLSDIEDIEDYDGVVWEEMTESTDLDQFSDFIIFETEEELMKFLKDLEDDEDEQIDFPSEEDFNWDDFEDD